MLGLAVVALLILAFLPLGTFKSAAERRLSAQIGQPVAIGTLTRIGAPSLTPRIELRDVRVAQPGWAGRGDLARIDRLSLRLSLPALILGRATPRDLEIAGMRLALVRDAQGRVNWRDESGADEGGGADLSGFRLRDARITYRDALQRRSFDAALEVSPDGLRIAGRGLVHDAPVTIAASGPTVDGEGAWPFRAEVRGQSVGMTLMGRMDAPLSLDRFTARVTAHADNLERLDALIEAGLPATQPVRLTSTVRREGQGWRIAALSGTIGRSDIAGDATIRKLEERTRIDGRLRARRFDFADLSSDEGRRLAAAKKARTGPRLIPDTEIDLENVARTDGRLEVRADQLLWPGSEPFRSLSGVLTVDRSRLRAEPVVLGLTHGRMSGRIEVDQRGRKEPLLALDLRLSGARLADLVPEALVDGATQGWVRLTGPGRTVREAIGRSTGRVALVTRDGTISARTASLLGQDVGRAVTTDGDQGATLRCLVARLEVTNGRAVPSPLIIDTSRAQTRATGSIDLATDRLALNVQGAPKRSSLLRFRGSVPVTGTIKAPEVRTPEGADSPRGILRMLGDAVAGRQQPLAADADCDRLAAQVLR